MSDFQFDFEEHNELADTYESTYQFAEKCSLANNVDLSNPWLEQKALLGSLFM